MSIPEHAIAYFSMEIALRDEIPTYSGGLGVLAGDTIRAAADLKIPMVAVTLLYRKGYFRQRLDANGWQQEEPVQWDPAALLTERPERITVELEGRTVQVRAWQADVTGLGGFVVPVFLLDTDVDGNDARDRQWIHALYGGDARYRLCQEAILGIGGVRMLRALGATRLRRFHMNEGHASLLTLELLEERLRWEGRQTFTPADAEAVTEQCVFTTHTPVPAGHDQFQLETATQVLGTHAAFDALPDAFRADGHLDMTHLALSLSRYINGVAKKHGEISRQMFERFEIDSITNGVHATLWTAPAFQALFDRYIPMWREDNFGLRYALHLPRQDVWQAHLEAKRALFERVKRETGVAMDPKALTLGFARRAAAYKRGDLLFHDAERLTAIVKHGGALQVVYAGKAHPQDRGGKELIQRIIRAKGALKSSVTIVYLENYDMALAQLITAGVDVWLNTPQPPLEASGTSGMKAALNGVPSLSTLDGWWLEGHIEGSTGWAIGGNGHDGPDADPARDAASLYDKLEHHVVPLFYYRSQDRWVDVMRQTIALNGSFFNTQRMLRQYVVKAYL